MNYNSADKKVASNDKKMAFEDEKVAFEKSISSMFTSRPTREKIIRLFDEFGYESPFCRADIKDRFNTASSSVGKLLDKLKNVHLIESVTGLGKGKYHFIKK